MGPGVGVIREATERTRAKGGIGLTRGTPVCNLALSSGRVEVGGMGVYYRPLVIRLAALTGLAASSASAADVLGDESAYCAFGGGCFEVTRSAYGRPFGVPLGAFGVAGFGLVLALTLVPRRAAARAAVAVALAAGLAGAALLLVQAFELRRFCELCVAADVSAIVLMAAALAGRGPAVETAAPWARRAAWAGAALLAVALPALWLLVKPGPLPPPAEVRAHWVEGWVTIVEVTDFECPYCARADHVLRQAVSEADNVRLVRLPAPLPHYPNSRPAARAYLAAKAQGKGEEMAAALFAAESRSAEECRRLAAGLGLKMDEYDRAVADPAADAELDATVEWGQRAGRGLPLIWVQQRRLPASPTPEQVRQALRRARPLGGR